MKGGVLEFPFSQSRFFLLKCQSGKHSYNYPEIQTSWKFLFNTIIWNFTIQSLCLILLEKFALVQWHLCNMLADILAGTTKVNQKTLLSFHLEISLDLPRIIKFDYWNERNLGLLINRSGEKYEHSSYTLCLLIDQL